MRRVTRVLVVGLGAFGILAFVFLVPIIPMTVSTYDLDAQHGLNICVGIIVTPPTMMIYGSTSYTLSHYGVVYVPSGGDLWWLPSPSHSSGLTCSQNAASRLGIGT
jgi:hypothetical protein